MTGRKRMRWRKRRRIKKNMHLGFIFNWSDIQKLKHCWTSNINRKHSETTNLGSTLLAHPCDLDVVYD